MGHPLLPDSEKVVNEFAVERLGDVTLITGSNMAGKSTFLRTVGVNLILAYAGGPVDAAEMSTVLYRPFTCIRVTDSVTGGFSYFYAEVKRLRALLDALDADDPLPLFFLIDEIFRGTNNRERLQGSRAYIRRLAGKHGVGLISTHDLELVKLADDFAQIDNAHFRDDVQDGRMVFDYTLRLGPCPTTNALKIMALEGLPVEDDVTYDQREELS
jgi:DNA mismatch repair ATPase MutS